ncbi:(2Fe-2S)-binding protein [bacterium]|nr:(2Fe-2S)-binding protein [bacterium]
MSKEKTKMIHIQIDGKSLEVREGTSVLEAALQAGIEIPHLCYHPAFPSEGSCRMCLVEIEGRPDLELACSFPVKDGMKVSTQSEEVTKARKNMLEFLLAEHPLDCPICDKAGECKLQDYYEQYGFFESRFEEKKEKKEKKVEIGKTLLLDQERCILCTRCIRFLKEITGTRELGLFNRGVHTGVNIYEGNPVENNYSGNLVDICPVGAITDKDFRFQTRNWFLGSGPSICPLCGRGCNIDIEYHPGFPHFPVPKRVYRIGPRENHRVNGYWICDYGRYHYSYIDEDRQEQIVDNKKEKLDSWERVLDFLKERIKKLYYMNKTSRIAVLTSSWLSNEELFLIRKIFQEDLNVEKIFLTDPLPGEEDNLLLTPERSPNSKGASQMGLNFKELDLNKLAERTEVLLMFGSHITEHFATAQTQEAIGGIETKVLLNPHISDLNSLMDVVLPTCVIAEKEGTLTNVKGLVQPFSPVFEAKGHCRPEWEVLVNLAKKLALNFRYYSPFTSVKPIFKKMQKEIGFFGTKK